MDSTTMSAGSAQPALPHPIGPGPSPLVPRHLVDVFLRPRRFFASQLALGHTPYVLFTTWCFGVASAIGRVDEELVRAQLGRPRPYWEQLSPFVLDSWAGYWAFALALGVLSGAVLWSLGGWWYRVRLRWAGERGADPRLARLVYIYASFVYAAPVVALALVQTLAFPSYRLAWDSEELYSTAILVFPFWSCVTSYAGATTLFNVARGRALLWFLVLPALSYLVAFGAIGAAAALASG